MDISHELVQRHILPVAFERLGDEPIILLEGPRTVGKSTLLRQIAADISGAVVDADDPATLAALRDDPSVFVDVSNPVLIDEYQRAPEVLDAIKTVLNRPPTRAGRFVLTGSSRHESLPKAAQALTGRLHRMQVLPLAQCELNGTLGLLPQLTTSGESVVKAADSTTTRQEYIDRILLGGFPLMLERQPTARSRWFNDYIRLTLERDVAELSRVRQAYALPEVLARLASQTAQILNRATIADAMNLDASTVGGYVRLLESVFLIRLLPAWSKRLTPRTAASPKVHIVDSGVAARLLRLTPGKLDARNPTTLTEFGHLMETFVVGELLKEVSWSEGVSSVGHWRTFDDDEVDLVIERDDGRVLAFEVKAGRRASAEAFRGLHKLRSVLGDAFELGVVLHTGERSFRYDDRLVALPIDRLWTQV